MYEVSEHIDIMAEPEDLFLVVGDLMSRGHYYPDGAIGMRELAPRPFSPTEKYLSGQRVAFVFDGESREHEITGAEEWDKAEARIEETRLRSQKKERYVWRLSELTMGTYRVTVTFSADYGAIEKISKGKAARSFLVTMLSRLKDYVEDKRTFAGPRTFVTKSVSTDPLDMP
ncbi:MAG: hypothetical protein M3R13_10045 [Armatimonadota bacterium]|nr:hypothetical protein [Armatimonadota bacterium]